MIAISTATSNNTNNTKQPAPNGAHKLHKRRKVEANMKKANNTNTAATAATATPSEISRIVDRVKYVASKHNVKITKTGLIRHNKSAYIFVIRERVKMSDNSERFDWSTIAEHALNKADCDRCESFMGTFNADKAAATLPLALRAFGLDVPTSVESAAKTAQERLDAAALKKETKEREFVANGIYAARADGADKAAARWERLAEKYPDATTGDCEAADFAA